MGSDFTTWLLLGACVVFCSAGIFWQVYRRFNEKRREALRRPRRRVERVGRRVEQPAFTSEKAPEVKEPPKERQGVRRPVMLAITTLADSPCSAELFIQRALEIDEPFYRELPIDHKELKPLEGLFARNVALARVPGDGLSRHVYALNFSAMIEGAYSEGFMPHPNATAADLMIMALGEDLKPLGDAMPVEDYGFGSVPHVEALWELCNPTDKKHELDDLLEEELQAIRQLMPRAKLLVPAVQGLAWTQHWDELFDLVRDIRRVGAAPGKAQERCSRIDELAQSLYTINHRIDANLDAMTKHIRTASEADMALTSCVAYMIERELSVLFLRTLSLLRVMSGDTYLHGIHCSANISRNVETFPDVRSLLEKARNIAYDTVERQGRGLKDEALALLGHIKKDADELEREHDEALARLRHDMKRVQSAVDQYLILQGRPRRYAVKLNADNTIAALMVLEH